MVDNGAPWRGRGPREMLLIGDGDIFSGLESVFCFLVTKLQNVVPLKCNVTLFSKCPPFKND